MLDELGVVLIRKLHENCGRSTLFNDSVHIVHIWVLLSPMLSFISGAMHYK